MWCRLIVLLWFSSGSPSKVNTSPAASQFFNQQDAVKWSKHTLRNWVLRQQLGMMEEIFCVKLHTEQKRLWPQAVVQRGSLEGCMYKQQFSIETEMHLIVQQLKSQSRSVCTIPCGKKEIKAFKLLYRLPLEFSGLFFSSNHLWGELSDWLQPSLNSLKLSWQTYRSNAYRTGLRRT